MAFDDGQGGFLPGAMEDQGGGLLGGLTPEKYGLLAAGLSILANSRGPNSRNAVGQGALQGLGAYQGALNSQALQGYRSAQEAKLNIDIAKQGRLNGLLGSLFGQPAGDAGLLPGATGMPVDAASAPQGGLAGATLDQIAAIKAAGGPDLTEAWKLAHFGESVAPGATTVLADGTRISNPSLGQGQVADFQNGRPVAIRNLPNSVQAAAAMAGATTAAQEGARAQFDLVPVPDGKGGTKLMPRSQAVGILGGGGGQASSDSAPQGLGTTLSPQITAGRTALPQVLESTNQMLNSIDAVSNAQGLPGILGMQGVFPNRPGGDAADAQAKVDQLQGKVFMQAYQGLRGGGQITEVEGTKAEAAIARLQKTQSEPEFRAALQDLRDVVQAGRNRAYSQAGITPPDANGVFKPKSAQELQLLPSGSLFRAPDGTLRRVP